MARESILSTWQTYVETYVDTTLSEIAYDHFWIWRLKMDYATCPRLHVNSAIRSARTLCALFLHDATYDDMCDVWNESSRRAIDRSPPSWLPFTPSCR